MAQHTQNTKLFGMSFAFMYLTNTFFKILALVKVILKVMRLKTLHDSCKNIAAQRFLSLKRQEKTRGQTFNLHTGLNYFKEKKSTPTGQALEIRNICKMILK